MLSKPSQLWSKSPRTHIDPSWGDLDRSLPGASRSRSGHMSGDIVQPRCKQKSSYSGPVLTSPVHRNGQHSNDTWADDLSEAEGSDHEDGLHIKTEGVAQKRQRARWRLLTPRLTTPSERHVGASDSCKAGNCGPRAPGLLWRSTLHGAPKTQRRAWSKRTSKATYLSLDAPAY